MIEFLRWLLVLEVLAVAAFPLATRIFTALPDRGAGLSPILGLLLVTYLSWLTGTALPVAAGPVLPLTIAFLLGVVSWGLYRLDALRALAAPTRRALLIEQALFISALAVWSLLRAYVFGPPILHTEQFMDMAFLNASVHSASYPPYDPWMSGHSINYYYFGYLAYAGLIKLSGVPVAVGYNLALSTLFAAVLTAAYSLGLAFTRSLRWAAFAPALVGLAGNWHGVVQVAQGHFPGNTYWWFWDSSRIVATHGDYTINEFPMFSFILGDLHPHVMALPFVLLSLACAIAILLTPGNRPAVPVPLLSLSALSLGSLFVSNSWDLPTYFLVVAGATFTRAYLYGSSRSWWRGPLIQVAALALLSVLLYLPFYLTFHAPVHGIGLVTTRTVLWQFLEVFGLQILLCIMVVGTLAALLQPAEEADVVGVRAETGSVQTTFASGSTTAWALVCVLLAGTLGFAFSAWTLLVVVALGLAAIFVLERVLNTEDPNRADALALILIAVACLVLALTELIYLRDSFDGSDSYRMNTIFKFYYQAWVLLGLAGSYGVYRALRIARAYFSAALATVLTLAVALALAASGTFPVLASSGAVSNDFEHSLNGMAWMSSPREAGSSPADAAGIRWLLAHAPARSVIVEATGGGYTTFARFSTFTGLPTVMGWPDHEDQWRGADPQIEQRVTDVQTLYATHNISQAQHILARYHVRYVVVGSLERQKFGNSSGDLAKFSRFLHVVFSSPGIIIYAV